MAPKDSTWSDEVQKRILEKKTHASFPQLKYPSLRDDGLKDSVQWLQGKSLDDGAEGMWRVHDKIYDFRSFIKNHPGGEEWLELTKGTDITEAFEAHHIYPTAEKLLNKYYIKDASGPRNSPFTFKDDDFYRTLKRAVREELKTIPKDISHTADRITDGIFMTLLFSSPLACWFGDYVLATVFYIISSMALCFLTVACHNYIHRRNNWRMYLFNLSTWSYRYVVRDKSAKEKNNTNTIGMLSPSWSANICGALLCMLRMFMSGDNAPLWALQAYRGRNFRVSHALSHHLYTNTLMDLELSGLEPILQYLPRKDKPLVAKAGFVTLYLMFPFIFLLNFCKRIIAIFKREHFFETHYSWHDIIGLLLPLWMKIISNAAWTHVIYTWLWIVCTASLLFFVTAVNAAHHHPDAIKDGDQPRSETPDWGVHQVEALLDRKDVNSNTFAVIILFGEHVLHHMFPTLDHLVLRRLHPVFLKHCEEYQANYRASTQFNLVIGQIRECMRTEFRTDSDRRKFKSN